ncbi:MAG: phosphoadenosine phosphosulfate reductase family protein, partial [Parvibaculaceae bacterium]
MYQSIIKRLSYFDGIDILEPLIKRVFKDRIALVSSFGAESAVLLHMAAQVDRNLPVIFIDTDKLFWETKSYRSKLVDHLGLT